MGTILLNLGVCALKNSNGFVILIKTMSVDNHLKESAAHYTGTIVMKLTEM